jgi:hypothetical protein
MSIRNKSTTKFNNIKSNIIKPHCSVCQSAGKPEEVYASHFVRENSDPTSKVVCPTLLNQSCLHCGKPGHTTSYCSLKKKQQREIKKEDYKLTMKAKESNAKQNVKKTVTNVFDLLNSDSENDEPISKKSEKVTEKKIPMSETKSTTKQEINIEEFPALSVFPIKRKATETQVSQVSFAKVAAKTTEEYETEIYEKKLMELSKKRITPQIVVKQPLKASDPDCDWGALDSDDETSTINSEDSETYDW